MASPKKTAQSKKKQATTAHPSFAEMIKECIIAHPDESRTGVSRPTIKKYVETKYGLNISASTVTNINRAIAQGAEKGLFSLPKGPSGKVKLAKGRSDKEKENTAPTVVATTKPKPAKKSVAPTKKPAPSKKPVAASSTRGKKTSATSATTRRPAPSKKAAAAAPAKKNVRTAPASKPSAKPAAKSTAKKTPAVKKPAAKASVSAKKPSPKRAPAKKTLTGTSSNKPAKATVSKVRPAPKKVSSRKATSKRT